MHRRHDLVSLIIWAAVIAALAQTASAQSALSTPDLSGIWTKPYLGWKLTLSGPGPVTNKNRRRQVFDIDGRPWPAGTAPLVNSASRLIGDYSSPILDPTTAAEGSSFSLRSMTPTFLRRPGPPP